MKKCNRKGVALPRELAVDCFPDSPKTVVVKVTVDGKPKGAKAVWLLLTKRCGYGGSAVQSGCDTCNTTTMKAMNAMPHTWSVASKVETSQHWNLHDRHLLMLLLLLYCCCPSELPEGTCGRVRRFDDNYNRTHYFVSLDKNLAATYEDYTITLLSVNSTRDQMTLHLQSDAVRQEAVTARAKAAEAAVAAGATCWVEHKVCSVLQPSWVYWPE